MNQKKHIPIQQRIKHLFFHPIELEPVLLWLKPRLLPLSLFIALLMLLAITYQVVLIDRFYPRTFIGDSEVTLLTKGQAASLIQAKFQNRANQKLEFIFSEASSTVFTIDLATASAKLDLQVLNHAFSLGRTGNWAERVFAQLNLFQQGLFTPQVNLSVTPQVKTIASQIDQEPMNATITINKEGQITTTKDKYGKRLDQEKLVEEVRDYLIFGTYTNSLPVKAVEPEIAEVKTDQAREALQINNNQPLTLNYEDKNWTIDSLTLLALFDLTQPRKELVGQQKLQAYLSSIASEIDQEIQEALFKFEPFPGSDRGRVTTFKPAREGRKLNMEKTVPLVVDAIYQKDGRIVSLVVDVEQPKVKTDQVNNLGIKELVGRGVSHFAGSIPNRVYNVNLTAVRLNGVLVPPGEVFSFNRTVGDISAATGFKQAYVIKEGRTVLDDGGGVCQDSTTLFRAVLNAGLPIVKRTAHAYRVGYYEQGFPPGLDATVFFPSVDFQFKNDTPGYILIQTYTEGATLYADLYGTSDGRQVNITKPIVTNVTPPPPELRQDDPTLPKGEVKQVDWAAGGASVTFKRTVTKNGERIIDETFRSNYRPWQAVYLVGTKEN